MIDAKHIAALEAWLKKTREDQNQLINRLREAEGEVEGLKLQISALDEVAQQAESMIDSLLVQLRTGARGPKGTTPNVPPVESNKQPADELPVIPVQDGGPVERSTPVRTGTVAYFNRPQIVRSSRIEPLSHRFADRTITQACTLLLKESGGPLHVNDLYNLLVSGGMEFKGNNPTISVAVSLNRNRRFRKVGPGTFDLMIREAAQAAS